MAAAGDDSSNTHGAERPSVTRDLRTILRRWPWVSGALGVLISALCAAGFTALAGQVYNRGPVVALDRRLLELVGEVRSEPAIAVWSVLTWVGDTLVVFPLAVVAGVLLVRRKRSWSPLVLLVASSAGVGSLVGLTKWIIARPRPPALPLVGVEDGFGFPSGHSAQAAAVYLMIALLILPLLTGSRRRAAVLLAAMALTATAMLSRIVLGVHSPSDVFGGLLLGVGWTVLLLSLRPLARSARELLHRLAHA
ncbi:phosphatase PAP2 family protein [Allosaccharopolyspora coralli]|uniref:Phosphatase PAP2 family protein n=1 Tax=Allosaccharopolyspora coralli TaxID=2665642 RepID=A0A5Q3Q326_9PSEU|nr:phosphatase PAP2 family protein [Allosaccharopolyspora coralli]QGK68998.1 phosphatase PAP2 family protein [Allosaccharopolyspora coralli]